MFLLRTFGGLSIERDGAPFDELTGSRKPLILLAILAADEVVSRDRLLTLLWPESDAERARGSLRQSLHLLRQALGAGDIVAGTVELRLNPARIGSDVGMFRDAVRANDAAAAVAAYRGPFLDAVHAINSTDFEHWRERRSEELRQLHAAQLESLGERAEAEEDFVTAAGWWRKRQDADPTNGVVAARLIRALDGAGQRAAALRHAQLHAAVLQHEFELPPDPGVEALAEDVRSRPPAVRPALERFTASVPGLRESVSGLRTQRRPVAGLIVAAAVVVLVVAGGLIASTIPSTEPRIIAATPESQDKARALEYLIKAQQLLQQKDVQSSADAKTWLTQAIALDPDLIGAHLTLASAEMAQSLTDPQPGAARAKVAVERVLAIDSTSVAAHAMMVMIRTVYDRDYAAAERHLRFGYALDPTYAPLHNMQAMYLLTLGRTEESLRPMQRANEMHATAPPNLAYLAVRYVMLGNHAQARMYLDQALARDSAFFMARWTLGRIHLAEGRYEAALREFSYPGTDLGGIGQQAFTGYTLARAGRTAEARALVDALLEQRRAGGYVSPVDIAIIHIGLGEPDRALQWLERLVAQRGQRAFLKADPIFDPVREHPRFRRLLVALNLPV
jgi:DNA-binding SARP family transcriptional activator/Tfp pilus assembly protein PilF